MVKIAKLPTAKPILKPLMNLGEKGPIKVRPMRVQSGIRLQSIQTKPDANPVVLQKFKLKKKESSQQVAVDKAKIPPSKIQFSPAKVKSQAEETISTE